MKKNKTPQVIQTHPRDFTLVILIRENEVVKKRRKYEFPSPLFLGHYNPHETFCRRIIKKSAIITDCHRNACALLKLD